MRIGIPKESFAGETRVAGSPETVKKLVGPGHELVVARGAGTASSMVDSAYEAAGARMADQAEALCCDMVLKVRSPSDAELGQMKKGAVLVGMLSPYDRAGLERLAGAGITAFAMEAAPRTTRAQSLDVLSSQANLAG